MTIIYLRDSARARRASPLQVSLGVDRGNYCLGCGNFFLVVPSETVPNPQPTQIGRRSMPFQHLCQWRSDFKWQGAFRGWFDKCIADFKKRRISTVSLAERAFISRSTLYKVERGYPTVSIGVYATVLAILGLANRLGEVADRRIDSLGLDIE